MDQLQTELAADYPDVAIQILGINEAGFEDGNSAMTDGRDLPWLQDTIEVGAWSAWAVTYRDVQVLDADNHLVGIYNVTDHDLSIPAEYAGLRALLLSAAGIVE